MTATKKGFIWPVKLLAITLLTTSATLAVAHTMTEPSGFTLFHNTLHAAGFVTAFVMAMLVLNRTGKILRKLVSQRLKED
jgi:hypothetical protein